MINQHEIAEHTVFSVQDVEMAERYLIRWQQNNKAKEFTDDKIKEIIFKCSAICNVQKISITTALERFYPYAWISTFTLPAKKRGPGFDMTQKNYDG